MSFYRFAHLVLILVVVAVTALNSYTTRMHCELYLSGVEHNNNELVRTRIVQSTQRLLADKDAYASKLVDVAKSEAERAALIEGQFNDLVKQYVQLRHAFNQARMEVYGLQQLLSVIGNHIRECHELMKSNNITPPALPEPPTQEQKEPDKPAPKGNLSA